MRKHRTGEHTKLERAAPACRFLYSLIPVQYALEQLCHEGFEVSVRGLADHPVGIAAEGPAGDGADQGLLVAQTLDEVGDELRQVGYHALHTAWKDKTVLHILRNATFWGISYHQQMVSLATN